MFLARMSVALQPSTTVRVETYRRTRGLLSLAWSEPGYCVEMVVGSWASVDRGI